MDSRAQYDWTGFAKQVRQRLADDGRGYRALADEIGITFTDLSRAASGHVLSAHKVIALCDWLKLSVRAFYVKPEPTKSTCCSGSSVKHAKDEEDGHDAGIDL